MDALKAYLLGRGDLAEAMNTIIVPGDVTHTWGPNPVAAGQAPAGLDVLPAAGYAVANPMKRLFPHHNLDVRDPEENTTVCIGQLIDALNAIEKAGTAGIPGITPSELALAKPHLIAHAQMLVSDRPDYIAPDPNRGKYDGEVIYNIKPSNDPGVHPRVTTVPMGEAIELNAGETLSDFESKLRQAMADKFGEEEEDRPPYVRIDAVFGDQVVFSHGYDKPIYMTTWARGASGEFIFTPPVEVERITSYKPKPAAASEAKTEQTKREEDHDWKADAFAYVPDPEKPSTWKLRIKELVGGKATVTKAQLGRAAAALGKGFRGQKVEIPDDDLAKVKAKIRAAYKSLDVEDEMIPKAVREAATPRIPFEVAERDMRRATDFSLRPMALSVPEGTKDEAAYVRAIEIAAKQAHKDLFGEQGAMVSLIQDGRIVVSMVGADLDSPSVAYHEMPLRTEGSRYVVGAAKRIGEWRKRGDPPEWEWA